MFLLMLIYHTAFLVMWVFLWFTPFGAILSATLVWLFASYHNKLINDNYEQYVSDPGSTIVPLTHIHV